MGALDDGYPSQARLGGTRRPAGALWGSLECAVGAQWAEVHGNLKVQFTKMGLEASLPL